MQIPPAKIVFPPSAKAEVLAHMEECLTTGSLTLGKYGKELEEKFAQFVGVRYAVAVNSGTSALEIPLRILGVTGKEVLVPTNTFFATPAAVLHAGGRVRFVDADPETMSINVDGLEQSITSETVGVIVVHIGGLVTPRMPEIQRFCQQHGLFLLEDAAHAHGSRFNGQMAGSFGQVAAFSFYPTKVMTSAEGGMIVMNDQHVYEEALIYRDQGKAGFLTNFHTRLGYNWRMSEPHAIIGLAQFTYLPDFIADRQRVVRIYDEGLARMELITASQIPTGCESNYYKYIAMLKPGIDRARIKQVLREQYNVRLSGEVYDTPCHRQPIFEDYAEGSFPHAEDVCARHICLPVYAGMTDDEAQYVLDSLDSALRSL